MLPGRSEPVVGPCLAPELVLGRGGAGVGLGGPVLGRVGPGGGDTCLVPEVGEGISGSAGVLPWIWADRCMILLALDLVSVTIRLAIVEARC